MSLPNRDHMGISRELAGAFGRRARAADRQGELNPQDLSDLKASGWLGFAVPTAYNGPGLSFFECYESLLTLAKASTSTALVAAMHMHITGHAFEHRNWSLASLEKLAQCCLTGKLINAVASEPVLGSPARGGLAASRLLYRQGKYVLEGHKTWATGAGYLDYGIVLCQYQASPREEPQNVNVFAKLTSPEVVVEKTWGQGLALRASDSHDLIFNGLEIHREDILASSNSQNLWFPIMMATTYFGAALAAEEQAIAFCQSRVPSALGKAIIHLESIQRQLGEIHVQNMAARALLERIVTQWSNANDKRDPTLREAMYADAIAAKVFVIESALKVTENCLRVVGGSSLSSSEVDIERYFRDVRAGLMHPPTGDKAYQHIARYLAKHAPLQGQNEA